MPSLDIPEKMLPFIEEHKRIKISVGGRGGGKSIAIADMLIMHASMGSTVCCGREFQNSIDDSVHSLMCSEIDRLGAQGFSILRDRIQHESGGQIFYKGLARNPESLKSLSGVDYFWVEEAQTISEKSLKLLTPSVRSTAGSDSEPEIWFSMNRGSSQDPIVLKYLERAEAELKRSGIYSDDVVLAIEINYADNPWFPSELEAERIDDHANMTRAKYRHVWEGDYNDDVENSIILPEWFDACIDAHKKLNFKPVGKKIVSHDPSDVGSDDKGLCLRHGSVVLDVISNPTGDVNDGMDWALGYAIQKQANTFIWDGDGLGLSLRRQASESLSGRSIDQQIFRGSEQPDSPDALYDPVDTEVAPGRTNKDVFRNKRAQYFWILRDRMYNTYRALTNNEYIDPDKLLSISSNIEHLQKLRSEVCRIPLRHNSNGFIQIESKEKMLKDGIPSPNMADALMMSLAISAKMAQNHTAMPPRIRPIGRMR